MERLKQDETVFGALFTCSIRPSARSARLGEPLRNHRRPSPTAVGPAGQRSGENPGVWRGWSQRSGPSRARYGIHAPFNKARFWKQTILTVIPAKAGIQSSQDAPAESLVPRLRGDDEPKSHPFPLFAKQVDV